MSTMPPRRPQPDPGLSPSEWHTQELLLMREVMRGIGRSLAPALVLREMLHLMSELLGLDPPNIERAKAQGCRVLLNNASFRLLDGEKVDEEIRRRLHAVVADKLPGHGINDPSFIQPARPMSAIGG